MAIPVSVVIIFKDEQRFLLEAVESVFEQTSDAWELLLVDDGSTDTSGELARQQAEQHPGRVRYLQHPGQANLGMSASRNLGLAHAQGRYVAFLDADDVWLPTKLEEQVALMLAHADVGLVYGPVQLWHSWVGGPVAPPDEFCDLGVPTDTVIPPPRLLPQLLGNRYQTPTTSGSLLSREVLQRVGGAVADFQGMYEDQVLFTKVLAATSTYVSGRCWTRYRQRQDSTSARFEREVPYPEGRLHFLTWARDHLAATEVTDAEVRRALRWELLAARHPRLVRVGRRLARSSRALWPGSAADRRPRSRGQGHQDQPGFVRPADEPGNGGDGRGPVPG
jgi:glycosyltransferase involved in cell wall biosynthesis